MKIDKEFFIYLFVFAVLPFLILGYCESRASEPANSEVKFPIWQESLYVNESRHTELIERCTFATMWTKDERNAFTRSQGFVPGYTMSKILDNLSEKEFGQLYDIEPMSIPYKRDGKENIIIMDRACNVLRGATKFVLDEFFEWYSGQRPYCFGLAHTKGECAFYSIYAAAAFTVAGVGVAGSSTWAVSANVAHTETEGDEYAGGGPIGTAIKTLLYFLLDYGVGKGLDATMKQIKNNPCKFQPDTWDGSPVTCTATSIGD